MLSKSYSDLVELIKLRGKNEISIDKIFEFKDDSLKERMEFNYKEIIDELNNLSSNEIEELYLEIKDDMDDYGSYLISESVLDNLIRKTSDDDKKELLSNIKGTLTDKIKYHHFDRLNEDIMGNYIKENKLDITQFSILIPSLIINGYDVNIKDNVTNLSLDEFTKRIVYPYFQLMYIAKNNLDKVTIKGLNKTINEYFIDIAKTYVDYLIDYGYKKEINELLNMIIGDQKYRLGNDYINYRIGSENQLVELFFNINFEKLKTSMFRLVMNLMEHSSKKDIKELNNKDLYKHFMLMNTLEDDDIPDYLKFIFDPDHLDYSKRNLFTIFPYSKVSGDARYMNNLLGIYLYDSFINDTKINNKMRLNTNRSLKLSATITNKSCDIKYKKYYIILDKYFYDPSNLSHKEYVTSNFLIDLIHAKDINSVKIVINRYKDNPVYTKLLCEEFKDVINAGIKLNTLSVFGEKGINKVNIIDLKPSNLVSPLLFKTDSQDYELKVDLLKDLYKEFDYDYEIKFSNYHFKDLNEYFESRVNLRLLKELDIELDTTIKYDKLPEKIISFINDKLRGFMENTILIISYDNFNITKLTINQFVNGLCDYLGQFFPDESDKLRKTFRTELVKNVFR
ncbi:hypothetical protein [Staphylococcus phage vB_StaM_SA1]|nr:hypothetical protein [Staphylococcus phage vB_StaM_SA1]